MIQKMTNPQRPPAQSLADEIGVSRASLYRWVSEADTLDVDVSAEPPSFTEAMQRLTTMKRPQDWSAEEKLAAVLEAATLTEDELGAFLRHRGFVITSYSIHYTKLYENGNASNANRPPWPRPSGNRRNANRPSGSGPGRRRRAGWLRRSRHAGRP